MLRIRAKVIEKMIEVRIELGPNPDPEVKVGRILDKLFVGIVKSPGTSRRIAKIQRRKRVILQTL